MLAISVTIPLLLVMTPSSAAARLGKAMRATAQDPEAARLMGINVDTTISLTFLLGGMLAGAAGLIYALYQTTIWYFQGFTAGLLAFTAAVMGGIGNLRGAVLGGLIIGCIQQISDNRIGSEWTPAIVFGYLVLIMVFKPSGLLGEQTREADERRPLTPTPAGPSAAASWPSATFPPWVEKALVPILLVLAASCRSSSTAAAVPQTTTRARLRGDGARA